METCASHTDMMLRGKAPNHPYNVKKLEASNGPNQGMRRSRRKRDGMNSA
jgi:hypothetical protein